MALNNLTRVTGSGFGTETNINTTGIITAASFSGDGSSLTGVVGSGSGLIIQEEGSNVGTAGTINFVGTGVTATMSGAVATIEITSSGGGGGGGGLSNVVEDTTPQLGGNLDLNSKDITGTGNISITGSFNVTGVSTFQSDVNLGDSDKIHLGADQDLDIYHNNSHAFVENGTGNLYLRSSAGTSINIEPAAGAAGIIANAGGDVELYYNNSKKFETTSTGAIVTGTLVATATTATNVTVANEASDTECFVMFGVNATGDNAPKSSSSLKYNSSTGGLSAGSFIGDGSGLTGITASGSGVIVRDGGSLVGTAGTIDFGANVSVSPISAGVVTVTASAGSIPGINTSGTTQVNNLTATGVITATSFSGNGASVTNVNAVSIGGTPLTDLQKKNADTDLVMFNQILHFGPANTKSRIRWSGTTSLWDLIDGDLKIRDNTTDRFTFERTTGNFSASNVNVSGIITASSFSGSGANLTNLPASGISTAFTNVQATWSVGGDTGGYTFTGPGQDGAEQNPDIYLVRGQKYRFINSTGSGHPFAIRVSDGGAAYTDGVSGSQSGTQDFSVQHDAPVRLVYQCTIHSGMKGNIYIVGGSDWRMTDVTTAQTPEIYTNLNVGIGTDDPERTLSIAGNNPMIQIEGTGGNGKQWSIISSDDITGAAAASRGGNFVIYDDTSGGLGDVLTLTGIGGSMGLGIQDPGAKLHVSAGNIKVDSGFGIDFSANGNNSGMTSELLDDYEEGTFTVSSTGILNQGSLQTAHYVKIGNVVHYMINIYQSGNNMSWSAGSTITISAFTPISNFHTSPSLSWYTNSSTSDTQPAYFNSGSVIVLNAARSGVRHLWGFITVKVQ